MKRKTDLLSQKAHRASMRANAMLYRSCIAGDYTCDLPVKVRFGLDFLRAAISDRKQAQSYDRL